MQPDTLTLLAVVAAPLALMALMLAIATSVLVRRARRGLTATTTRLEAQESAMRADLAEARRSLDTATILLARVRADAERLDPDVADLATTLRAARSGIERLSRSRIGPAVRAMQVAGALARVALLWRTPAR